MLFIILISDSRVQNAFTSAPLQIEYRILVLSLYQIQWPPTMDIPYARRYGTVSYRTQ